MDLSVNKPSVCERDCICKTMVHQTKLVVLTGGPGAGKTAVLEIARKQLCNHIAILPEAASIVFGGGFWRLESNSARQAAQKAIMHVQQEMENLVLGEHQWALGLCDRGVPDGLAYWPDDDESFWQATGTTLAETYDKYYSVIHLRTPSEDQGYNHQNPIRIETAHQAAQIDEKIHAVWSNHPRYRMVDSMAEFITKAEKTLSYLIEDLPECCRSSFQ